MSENPMKSNSPAPAVALPPANKPANPVLTFLRHILAPPIHNPSS